MESWSYDCEGKGLLFSDEVNLHDSFARNTKTLMGWESKPSCNFDINRLVSDRDTVENIQFMNHGYNDLPRKPLHCQASVGTLNGEQREHAQQVHARKLPFAKFMVVTRILAPLRTTTKGIRFVRFTQRLPKLSLTAMNKGFVSSVAGFICWLNLMIVSAVVVGAWLDTMSAEGNLNSISSLVNNISCCSHIKQAPNFWGLPYQREHPLFSPTCVQLVCFSQKYMNNLIHAMGNDVVLVFPEFFHRQLKAAIILMQHQPFKIHLGS
ncbi:hypothetical protein LWI28_019182 [Acer negundo]|uniref:Uncharacterized protein n=1 Tax=Acer negundo TaxID=4023 RepID=A0AAD5NNN4_ACENE|nr:hypothetical protein LWI28_019182 [Acer negundo]